MHEIIYYSRTAPTHGSFIGEDLQKAGRIDIAVHTIIASFFLSQSIRTDVKLHLIFAGPPDPQKHLELKPVIDGKTGIDKIYLAKKDISGVLKKMLYKYKEGEKREVFPGFFIEKKGFLELVKEMYENKRNLYILDPNGEDIREAVIKNNPVFILGDHKGLPLKELKRLKKICAPISIGPKIYFASQTVAVLNNEIDRREKKNKINTLQ
ncbi:MAG: tRNA (pseudouridine(54)-N(1))-methyltransferase TrmY [Nanoarchaeota archaeon]